MVLYDEQLGRYVARFGAESLLVLDYALVTGQPDAALDRVCDHLGVAWHAFATTVQYNRSGVTSGPVGTRLTRLVRAAPPRTQAVLPVAAAPRLGRLAAPPHRPHPPPDG